MSIRDNIRDFMHGAAYGQYERELRRQAAELNDLFLLLCYMEVVGLPNPATLYLLDIYPYLLDSSTSGTAGWAWTGRRSATCPAADEPMRARLHRQEGPVLRRQGRRRQDDLRVGDGARGQPRRQARAAGVHRSGALHLRHLRAADRAGAGRAAAQPARPGDRRRAPSPRATSRRSRSSISGLFGHAHPEGSAHARSISRPACRRPRKWRCSIASAR